MKAVFEFCKVELILFSRLFVNIFFTLCFPLMMLFTFGSIYGNSKSDAFGGFGTIDVSIPAYAILVMSVSGLMTLPITLSGYREKRIIKRFRATPVNPFTILFSQFFVNILMSIIGVVLLILAGVIVYGIEIEGDITNIILAFSLSMISIFSIGFMIASVAPSYKWANAISNIIYFPCIFLSGATVPIEIMPEKMQDIAFMLPLGHAVDFMKGMWLNKDFSDYYINILVLCTTFAICTIISIISFRWE